MPQAFSFSYRSYITFLTSQVHLHVPFCLWSAVPAVDGFPEVYVWILTSGKGEFPMSTTFQILGI